MLSFDLQGRHHPKKHLLARFWRGGLTGFVCLHLVSVTVPLTVEDGGGKDEGRCRKKGKIGETSTTLECFLVPNGFSDPSWRRKKTQDRQNTRDSGRLRQRKAAFMSVKKSDI